ncbi:MAG: hypothetical protein AAF581_01255 [Planctomycetota bacterium]
MERPPQESQPTPPPPPVAPPPAPPLPGAGAVVDPDVPVLEAGQSTDEGKGRVFPCDGCGADLKFHIGSQTLTCPYCGHQKEIDLSTEGELPEQDFDAMLKQLAEWKLEKEAEAAARSEAGGESEAGADPAFAPQPPKSGEREIRCDSCGAQVTFVGTLTSRDCPYCGSPIQEDQAVTAERRIPVDGVLPFKVNERTAKQELGAWVKSRWFAPSAFKKRGIDGRFSGVYLPYWTYDTLTFNRYDGQRGEYYYVTVGSGKNRRTERRTRWYPASGKFQRFFDDVLILAGKGLRRKRVQALEPWPLHDCVPHDQQVVAGFLARTYDIGLSSGFGLARTRIDAALLAEVKSRIGGDTQRVHSVKTRYDSITYKHLLLPAWVMGYRYREKLYQVIVNAATGEVQGDRPWSWVKITCAVLGGLALAGGIFAVVQLQS